MAMMLSPECQTRRAEDTLQNSALIFADGPAGFNTGLHDSDRTAGAELWAVNARSRGSRHLVHIAIDLPTGASSPFTLQNGRNPKCCQVSTRMAVRALPLFLCG